MEVSNTKVVRGIFEVWEDLWLAGKPDSQWSYLHFFHQALDLVHHLVSVRLVDVGTEADLAVPWSLRYWGHSKHLCRLSLGPLARTTVTSSESRWVGSWGR